MSPGGLFGRRFNESFPGKLSPRVGFDPLPEGKSLGGILGLRCPRFPSLGGRLPLETLKPKLPCFLGSPYEFTSGLYPGKAGNLGC